MAAVWKAPVVFVCENNGYMEYTPIGAVTAVEHPAADRASAYGLDSILVDGNDVDAVHAVARTAVDRARAGDGPSLIEALTYRHGGHSRADPGKYRPDEEVAAWKARDPIPSYRTRLEAAGVDAATLDAIEAETHDAVAAAEAEARAAPEPSPDVLETQLWSDGGSSWRNLTYRAAIARGIAQEMRRDPTVVLIGEDVGAAGGVFKLTEGLFAEFGDGPRPRHADQRAGHRRGRHGRRDDRSAADRRTDVQRLLRGRPGTWSSTRSPRPAT